MPRIKDPLLLPDGKSQDAHNCRFDLGGIGPLRPNLYTGIDARTDITTETCSVFLYRGVENAPSNMFQLGPISNVYSDGTFLYAADITAKKIHVFSVSNAGKFVYKSTMTQADLGTASFFNPDDGSPLYNNEKCIWGNGKFIFGIGGTYIYSYSVSALGVLTLKGSVNVGSTMMDIFDSSTGSHDTIVVVTTDKKIKAYHVDPTAGTFTLKKTIDTYNVSGGGIFAIGGTSFYVYVTYYKSLNAYIETWALNGDGSVWTSFGSYGESANINLITNGNYLYGISHWPLADSYAISRWLINPAPYQITSPDSYHGAAGDGVAINGLQSGIISDETYIYTQIKNQEGQNIIVTFLFNEGDKSFTIIDKKIEPISSDEYPNFPKSLALLNGYLITGELACYAINEGLLTEMDRISDGDLVPYDGYVDSLGNLSLYFFMWNDDDTYGGVDAEYSPVVEEIYSRVYFTQGGFLWATDKDLFKEGGTNYPMEKFKPSPPAPTSPCTITGTPVGSDPTLIETRGYVSTWVNKYGSEGPPSPVSNLLDLYDGNECDIASIENPSSQDISDYVLETKRLYRINQGSSNAVFQYVDEINITTTTYTDTVLDAALGEVLESTLWDAAPDGIRGLISIGDGFAAFVDNYVCFSVPKYPHAWPRTSDYQKAFVGYVIGLGTYGTTVVVLTEFGGYLIVGANDPPSAIVEKVANSYACLIKKGIVNATFGVMYPSAEGICLIGDNPSDIGILTKEIMDRDSWFNTYGKYLKSAFLWESSYVGFCYNSVYKEYFGFIFNPTTKNFNTIDLYVNGGFYDDVTEELYLAILDENGTSTSLWVFDKDETSTPLTLEITGKRSKFLRSSLKIVKVLATEYPIAFSLYNAEQDLTLSCSVVSEEPQRIPSANVLIDSAEVTLGGTGFITACYIASTMGELPV